LALILCSLLALRVVIGWHFYTEGVTKLKAGNFSAEPFLRNANGPLADVFQLSIPDHDGRLRLGLVQSKAKDGEIVWDLDPLVTEELWKGFAYRAARVIGFGDPQLIAALQNRSQELKARIAKAQDVGTTADVLENLQAALDNTSQSISNIRNQKELALAIVQRHIDEYRGFLAENELEILAYFRGGDRHEGFDRDGQHKSSVAQGVRSLRSQTDQIEEQRVRDARAWLTEVDQMWKGLEIEINALTVPEQGTVYVSIDAPQTSNWSLLPWINRIVPWFDTIIGACLILGLFTRAASLAGAAFLFSIIATQPPFFAGSAPTIVQIIELVGLLVLFATGAGRYAGLDVFWTQRRARAVAVAEG
jgi:uncharacterized membrane protein YphA (DoxX/SURF4 family)